MNRSPLLKLLLGNLIYEELRTGVPLSTSNLQLAVGTWEASSKMCQRLEITSATLWLQTTPGPLALSFYRWDDNPRPGPSDPLSFSMGAEATSRRKPGRAVCARFGFNPSTKGLRGDKQAHLPAKSGELWSHGSSTDEVPDLQTGVSSRKAPWHAAHHTPLHQPHLMALPSILGGWLPGEGTSTMVEIHHW